MSILIKGMEMPQNCCECPINLYLCKHGYEYLIQHRELYDKRADDCPLVSVPPHGDLIDRDALSVVSWKEDEVEDTFDSGVLFALDRVDALPTIIPAEE